LSDIVLGIFSSFRNAAGLLKSIHPDGHTPSLSVLFHPCLPYDISSSPIPHGTAPPISNLEHGYTTAPLNVQKRRGSTPIGVYLLTRIIEGKKYHREGMIERRLI
jgi:hypothetical protein